MAGFGTPEDLADIEAELVDRYGELPQEAHMLLAIIGLKQQCRKLGVNKLEQSPEVLVFSFVEHAQVNPDRLLAMIQSAPKRKGTQSGIRFTPDRRLVVPYSAQENIFQKIQSIIDGLQGE